jgi:hypothetical protein
MAKAAERVSMAEIDKAIIIMTSQSYSSDSVGRM